MPSARSCADGGRDDVGLLVAERAVLARMRVEAGDGQAGGGDAEPVAAAPAR